MLQKLEYIYALCYVLYGALIGFKQTRLLFKNVEKYS